MTDQSERDAQFSAPPQPQGPYASQPPQGPAVPPGAYNPGGAPQYLQNPGYVQAPKRGNAMAITGFVVAVVALLLCFIPIINNFAFFLAIVALVFGIIGLVKARKGASHRGLSIAAIVVAVLSGVGVLASQALYSNALDSISDDLDAATSADQLGTDGAGDADAASEQNDDAAEQGTRDNPFPFSEQVSNDDWTVQLGEPEEAADKVLAENQFNEKPAQGMEYWIVPVDATYTGDETGLPMMDLRVEFVGDDAKTYSDSCGVIPDDISDSGELYDGGNVSGNVCVEVPQGASGEWTLQAGFLSDPTFFATKG